MFCPRCGAPNRAQSKRCASCSAGLTPQPDAGAGPGRPRRVVVPPPSRRPVPQAPSTQMGPPAKPPQRHPDPPSSIDPWPDQREVLTGGLAGISDEATLLEAPSAAAIMNRPEAQPTPDPLPPISSDSFRPGPTSSDVDMLQAETIMTPSGGAERRAWQEVADAGAQPAKQRFSKSLDEDSFGKLDITTDPEMMSDPGIDATRPILSLVDDNTIDGEPVPDSVRALQPAPAPAPAGPHGTRKLPTHRPAPAQRPTPARGPDTRTHSLESLGEGDEPPNEATRLGELAGPNAFDLDHVAHPLLESKPVQNAPEGVAPSETVAAPGELAGLIEDLEARARPSVREGPPAPPNAAPPQTLGGTPSMVRRGLQSPLPPNEPTGGPRQRPEPARRPQPEPERRPQPAELRQPTPRPLDETDQELDSFSDSNLVAPVAPLEATHALLENYEDNGIPSDATPLIGSPELPELMGREDTGLLEPPSVHQRPKAAKTHIEPEPEPEPGQGAGAQWQVAPYFRRLCSMFMDALVIAGLLAVPSLLGLFGDAVAQASPIDPDEMSGLLMQGALTLPLIAGAGIALIYLTLTTALGGRSLGKLAFGLTVVRTKTGQRLGFGRALLRSLFVVLGALFAGIGPLWFLVSGYGRSLHDVLSGSTAVRVGSQEGFGDDDAPAG